MQAPAIRFSFRHWLALLLLAGPLWAWAQQAQQIDPPGRVAYISLQEGTAVMATDGRGSWTPAPLNMPVTTGTRLATEAGSRTELQSGWSAFRLSGKSDLEISELDDDSTRLALTDGTLSTRVRDLQPGKRFEIDTPNIALVASQPGEYRFDVDPRADTTRVSVFSGSATVYGDGGQSVALGAREQAVFSGRGLNIVSRGASGYPDAFDQWAASRDAQADRSASARYVSPGTPGYQQLDAYGDWSQDTTYGAVWYPRVAVESWAPYRYGQWTWVDPWGWTWVDDAPWGFAPFHYGRWAQIGPRWAWVPGPVVRRPVYAPALVGFVGSTGSGTSWGISLGSSGPGTAWFPLAPGEYWEPHYRASQRYRHALNPWANARAPGPDRSYFFQRHPSAITAVSRDQFRPGEGRRPRYTNGTQLPPSQWAGTRVVPPPPRPNPMPGSDRNTGGNRPFPGADHAGSPPRGQQPIQPPSGRFPERDAQRRDEWGHLEQPPRNQRPQLIDQQRDAQRRDEWGQPAQPQRNQRPQVNEQPRDAQRRDEWGHPTQSQQIQRPQVNERQRDAQQRDEWGQPTQPQLIQRQQMMAQQREQEQQRRDQQQRMELQQRQAAQQQQLMEQQRAAQREQQAQQHREQQQRAEQQRQQAAHQQNQWRQQQMQQRQQFEQQQQQRQQQFEQQRQQQQQRAQPMQREEQRGREQRPPGPRYHEGFN